MRLNLRLQRVVTFSLSLLFIAAFDPNYVHKSELEGFDQQMLLYIPSWSHLDSREEGAFAAIRDIKAGKPKFMQFGLSVANASINHSDEKIEYLIGGCVLGGAGYEFWKGYNGEMIKQGRVKS